MTDQPATTTAETEDFEARLNRIAGEIEQQRGSLMDVQGTFPFPFAGIDRAVVLTGLRLEKVIPIIAGLPKKDGGCGHKHNFAVESSGKKVYVSQLGAECISKALDNAHRRQGKERSSFIRDEILAATLNEFEESEGDT